jgi:hypothetical protein
MWLAATLVWSVVLLTAGSAEACWQDDALKPESVEFIRTGDTTATVAYKGFETFGASSGQFCGCGVAVQGLTADANDPQSSPCVASINAATIVFADSQTPIAGFNFAQDPDTTSGLNGLFSNPTWQGFAGQVTANLPSGTELDILIDVTLTAACSNQRLAQDLGGANARVGGDETNSDGTLTGNHQTLLQPGTATQVSAVPLLGWTVVLSATALLAAVWLRRRSAASVR